MNIQSNTPKSIFLDALVLPEGEERQNYLAAECGGDASLRAEVESLLRHHQQMGAFLEASPAGAAGQFQPSDWPIAEGPGSIIGPYKLLEQIGEGGMGVVFMAEQTHPVQRKVALKIVKPGMDTKQVIARFEAERQALAMMDHPNIARVLDAGTTGEESGRQYAVGSRQPAEGMQESAKSDSPPPTADCLPLTSSGRPYFVMELVRGVPITEFCDQRKLTIRERLELFINVCQAVQHAHQKGIIHRDLKPTNVLVTLHDTKPVVKVIDFGVAKATGQKLTEKTLFTGLAQMIGTPLYMSPEQAEMSGLDVDTRSDIYSLGVLLYELLTGTTPFDSQRLKAAPFDELRRIIREEEPPRPSTRLSTLAQQASSTISAQRNIDPRHLSRLFQRELDWIVMKCLEKDRNRRYEAASALAADVERYLHDEAVEACPPSKIYRLRKFSRRYRAALLTASLVLVALVLGTVVSTYQAIRATHAEQQAKAVSSFLVAAFDSTDPYRDGRAVTIAERDCLP